jgi:hypothetical protein
MKGRQGISKGENRHWKYEKMSNTYTYICKICQLVFRTYILLILIPFFIQEGARGSVVG